MSLPKPYFESHGITLYHGDNRKILPALPRADAIITDPPYGTTAIQWDDALNVEAMWRLFKSAAKADAVKVVFSAQPFTTEVIHENRAEFRYDLIWFKSMAVGFLSAAKLPLRAHEHIAVFGAKDARIPYNPQMEACLPQKRRGRESKGSEHYSLKNSKTEDKLVQANYPISVLRYSNAHGGDSPHPTAKPVDLLTWLVKTYTNPEDLVLEPYAGGARPCWRACAAADARSAPSAKRSTAK